VQLLRQAGRGHGLQFEAVFGKDHADSFLLLESGRADAFVMDASILSGNIANAKNPSDFRIVGEPLSIEPIGIMMRRDDPAFKSAVNAAIAGLIAAGRMPQLWDKWFLQPIPPSGRVIGLPLSENTKAAWANPNDKPAEDYRGVKPAADSADRAPGFDWQVFCKSTLTGKRVEHCFAFDQERSKDPTYLTWLLNAWKWTLAVSSLALVIALAVGLTVGALRTVPGIPVTKRVLAAGVELFRNIPILVQVFIWYYVLPSCLPFLKSLPSYVVVAVALGLFTAARLAEQMRAGILALPRGQIQAAKALGLSTLQSYRYVIMPVALRIIIPPLTSESMNIVKNSAIAFVVSVPELTMFAMQAQEETSRGVEIYAAVTCVYALTALTINRALGWIERRTQIPGPSSGNSATQGAV
jgi:glutamate/aspartate transport system permease protein